MPSCQLSAALHMTRQFTCLVLQAVMTLQQTWRFSVVICWFFYGWRFWWQRMWLWEFALDQFSSSDIGDWCFHHTCSMNEQVFCVRLGSLDNYTYAVAYRVNRPYLMLFDFKSNFIWKQHYSLLFLLHTCVVPRLAPSWPRDPSWPCDVFLPLLPLASCDVLN